VLNTDVSDVVAAEMRRMAVQPTVH
jgi:hypothetical protein